MALANADRVIISCAPARRAAWAMILKGANIAGEVIDDAVADLGAMGARVAGGHGWLTVSTGPLGLRAGHGPFRSGLLGALLGRGNASQ